MNRIITKGLGGNHTTLITKGFVSLSKLIILKTIYVTSKIKNGIDNKISHILPRMVVYSEIYEKLKSVSKINNTLTLLSNIKETIKCYVKTR